jgi:hypothetical protein
MNKVISLIALFYFANQAVAADAGEYSKDTYQNYGYAAGASVFGGSELKGGLRGAHVASNHHTSNFYYPGYAVVPNKEDTK